MLRNLSTPNMCNNFTVLTYEPIRIIYDNNCDDELYNYCLSLLF